MKAVLSLLCILAFLVPGCANALRTESQDPLETRQVLNQPEKNPGAEPASGKGGKSGKGGNGKKSGGLTIRKTKKPGPAPETSVLPTSTAPGELPELKPEKTAFEPKTRIPENTRVGAKPGVSPLKKSPEPEKPTRLFIRKQDDAGTVAAPARKTEPKETKIEKKPEPKARDIRSLSTDDLLKELLRRQRRKVREKPRDVSAKLRLAELLRMSGRIEDAKRSLAGLEAEKNFAPRIEKARLEFELGSYDRFCRELKAVLGEAKTLASLSIPVASFARTIEDYGRYTPASSDNFSPGSYFSAYIEIENFINERKTGSSFITSMEVGYEIRNTADRVVFEKPHFDAWEYTTQSHIQHLYINLCDYLPANLPAGKYSLRVYLLDRFKPTGAKATRDL
ncbi:MAG: tetratricopeptide repeat protein, partial [Planctomycetota bacterium]